MAAQAPGDIGGDLEYLSFECWRDLLRSLVARIALDPDTLECRIEYRLASQR